MTPRQFADKNLQGMAKGRIRRFRPRDADQYPDMLAWIDDAGNEFYTQDGRVVLVIDCEGGVW